MMASLKTTVGDGKYFENASNYGEFINHFFDLRKLPYAKYVQHGCRFMFLQLPTYLHNRYTSVPLTQNKIIIKYISAIIINTVFNLYVDIM